MTDLRSSTIEALDDLLAKCKREYQIYVKALHGLKKLKQEISYGPRQQFIELDKIVSRIKHSQNIPRPSFLWNQLRDILSLHPQNDHFLNTFRYLLSLWHPETISSLKHAIQGKHLFLHISCRHRKHLADRSIHSFSPVASDEIHLICVGRSGNQSQFKEFISLHENVLFMDVGDDYEFLHRKTFMAFAIVDLISSPLAIFKCDDDILLANRNKLEIAKSFLRSADAQYAGLIRHVSHHRDYWHGWHVGKCGRKVMHRCGLQFPLPHRYADGGLVYMIRDEGLREATYCYMTQRRFIESPLLGIEDAALGLVMERASIKPTPIDFTGTNGKSKFSCFTTSCDVDGDISHHQSDWDSVSGRTPAQERTLFLKRMARLRQKP